MFIHFTLWLLFYFMDFSIFRENLHYFKVYNVKAQLDSESNAVCRTSLFLYYYIFAGSATATLRLLIWARNLILERKHKVYSNNINN